MYGTVQGIITLVLMIAFITLIFRVFRSSKQSEYDEAANLPLSDKKSETDNEVNNHE